MRAWQGLSVCTKGMTCLWWGLWWWFWFDLFMFVLIFGRLCIPLFFILPVMSLIIYYWFCSFCFKSLFVNFVNHHPTFVVDVHMWSIVDFFVVDLCDQLSYWCSNVINCGTSLFVLHIRFWTCLMIMNLCSWHPYVIELSFSFLCHHLCWNSGFLLQLVKFHLFHSISILLSMYLCWKKCLPTVYRVWLLFSNPLFYGILVGLNYLLLTYLLVYIWMFSQHYMPHSLPVFLYLQSPLVCS